MPTLTMPAAICGLGHTGEPAAPMVSPALAVIIQHSRRPTVDSSLQALVIFSGQDPSVAPTHVIRLGFSGSPKAEMGRASSHMVEKLIPVLAVFSKPMTMVSW